MFSTSNNPNKRQKHRIAVELELDSGEILLGNLFLSHQQRLSDALNDDRRFLPLEIGEGEILHLAKHKVGRVSEIKKRSRPPADAYEMLGVTPGTAPDQLRAAYLEMVWATHPDRWLGSGLPEEALDALNRRLAVINSAYHRILRQRKAAAEAQRDSFGTKGIYKEYVRGNPEKAEDKPGLRERPGSGDDTELWKKLEDEAMEVEAELIARKFGATLEEDDNVVREEEESVPLHFKFRNRRNSVFGRKDTKPQ